MFARLGVWEIMAIIAVVGLIVGGKKLPDFGKTLGSTISNFKEAAAGKGTIEGREE